MTARFLLRFDDLCPAMNWRNWSRIEQVLERYGIKPIVAVVPDNQDPELVVDAPRQDFWGRVRAWQHAGWTIGLHGYQHCYETRDGGLLGINARSEFAGLPVEAQRYKVQAALEVFARHNVRPDVWVAPGHSFDETTIQVLIKNGVHVISDGFFWRPVRHQGMVWIPQQRWRLSEMPFGLWTACFHPNTMSEHDLQRFETAVGRFATCITSVAEVIRDRAVPHSNIADRIFSTLMVRALRIKRAFGA
jgi:peptidoglycan/xylan/chitin deacetylase (PgdA/CDA1 family)